MENSTLFFNFDGLPIKCPITLATWELSYKYNFVPLSWRKETLGKLDTSAAVLFNKLEEAWFQNYEFKDNWVLCDQLAMMAAIHPDSVTQATKHLATVELTGHHTRGMMVLDKRPEEFLHGRRKNVSVIEKIDTAKLQQCPINTFSMDGESEVGRNIGA